MAHYVAGLRHPADDDDDDEEPYSIVSDSETILTGSRIVGVVSVADVSDLRILFTLLKFNEVAGLSLE